MISSVSIVGYIMLPVITLLCSFIGAISSGLFGCVDFMLLNSWSKQPCTDRTFSGRCLLINDMVNAGQVIIWFCLIAPRIVDFVGLNNVVV